MKKDKAMNSTTTSKEKKSPPWKPLMIASFAVAVIAPIFGLAGTVQGMIGAFSTLENEGASAPSELAREINLATGTTAIGWAISIVGIVLGVVFLLLWQGAKRSTGLRDA